MFELPILLSVTLPKIGWLLMDGYLKALLVR